MKAEQNTTVTIKNKVTRLKGQLQTARLQLNAKKAEKDTGLAAAISNLKTNLTPKMREHKDAIESKSEKLRTSKAEYSAIYHREVERADQQTTAEKKCVVEIKKMAV